MSVVEDKARLKKMLSYCHKTQKNLTNGGLKTRLDESKLEKAECHLNALEGILKSSLMAVESEAKMG